MSRHLLVNALVDMIPDGKSWAPEEQGKWLKAAKEIFALVYSGSAPVQIAAPALPAPPAGKAKRPAGSFTPTEEHKTTAIAALPEMFGLAPDGVTVRMLQDRFEMDYGLARALLLQLGELPEYAVARKAGSNTLGLFPAGTVPSDDLSENQKAVLDALTKWADKDEGWIETPVREIAKAAGSPLGSIPSVIDSLERKGRIEVERNRGDGFNRYKVLTS